MKVGTLIDFLLNYDNNDKIEIEVYETNSGKYIDTTADVTYSVDASLCVPTLKIDVDAERINSIINFKN